MTLPAIGYRVRTLYATAAEFTAENPTLLEGELAYESDTGKEKIGDGVTTWVALPYKPGGGASFGATLIDSTNPAAIYVGKAPEGAAVGDATWTIRRSTFSSAGVLLTTGAAVDVTWTGRAGHNYT